MCHVVDLLLCNAPTMTMMHPIVLTFIGPSSHWENLFFLHLARLQRCELVVLDHPILIFELAKIFRQTFPKNHPHHLLLIS